MEDDAEVQVEGFASWVLAFQLFNAVIGKAVALLPADMRDNLPDIKVVTMAGGPAAEKRALKSSVETRAYVKPGDKTIYVTHWSRAFRDAEKGDKKALMTLAACIAHEQWHLMHGKDEAGAYDAQIDALKKMGAPNDLIKDAEKNRDFAVSTNR